MARALALLLVLGLALFSSPAQAERSRVVVLRRPAASSAVQDAIRRTEAELAAEGFTVVAEEAPTEGDLRQTLAAAARSANAVAAIAVIPDEGGATADVWVSDRVTDKTVIRTLRVDGLPASERPRALAIRAVELLRASFVEVTVPELEGPEDVPPDVRRWLRPPRGPLDGFAVQIGVGMLTSFDGIGPAGAPSVRLSWVTDIGLGARLSWLGPAFGPRPGNTAGSALVRQELATAELVYAPNVDWVGFTPIVWAGGGLYHLHANGDVLGPRVGVSDEVWAAAITAGAGMGYRLTDSITAFVDASAVVTMPRAVVTLFGEPLGRAGRPSLLADLGVAIGF